MTVLTRQAILGEMKKGNLKITPFSLKQLGPASYDLTLSNEFMFYRQDQKTVVTAGEDFHQYMKKVKTKSFILEPYGFVLGLTKEKISLPEDLAGWLGGRSRFARLGLQIHMTAAFIQPGVNNRQALEISNNSPNPIRLSAGMQICQIMFERLEGKARYAGKFKHQDKL